MLVKRNLKRHEPSEEEKERLKAELRYPKDRFELLSIDRVDEWTYPRVYKLRGDIKGSCDINYRSILVTLKCKRCGSVKQVVDKPSVGCKQGPCHQKWIDITGKRFGHLVALRYVKAVKGSKKHRPKWYWECQCDCGKKELIGYHELSLCCRELCSECSRKASIEKTRLPENGAVWHRLYREYRRNALMRKLVFELSYDRFRELTGMDCHYCGNKPKAYSTGIVRNSIDRVDNSKGYIEGNCVACCDVCNRMKMDHSVEFFFDHVVQICKHNKLRFNDYPEREYCQAVGNKDCGDTVKK